MRALIKRNFPEHGIVGEEYGNERTDAEYVWVLDPIDGTKSFISGMPAWGSLIGLTRNGDAGLRHDASAVHRASASPATAAPRAIAGPRASASCMCAPARRLRDAMLFTTSPQLMNAADRAAFGRVEAAVKLSRYGGDCYRLLHARGRPRRSRHRERA